MSDFFGGRKVAEQLSELLPSNRWLRKGRPDLVVHFWGDEPTWALLDDIAAVFEQTGNRWLYHPTETNCAPAWSTPTLLHPTAKFTEALFAAVEHLSGIDAGSLHINVTEERMTVRGVNKERHGLRRPNSKYVGEFELYRDELCCNEEPVPQEVLDVVYATSLCSYPSYSAQRDHFVSYTRTSERYAELLIDTDWLAFRDTSAQRLPRGTEQFDELFAASLDSLPDRRYSSEPPPTALAGHATVVRANVARLVELHAAAHALGVDPRRAAELVSSDVPAELVGDMLAAAFT